MLSQNDLNTIQEWENKFQGKFTANPQNVNLVLGLIHTKFHGVITEANLSAATLELMPVLEFVPGHEPLEVKAAKAKAQAVAEELERAKKDSRRRELENKIASGAFKPRTEFDLLDDAEEKRRESAAKQEKNKLFAKAQQAAKEEFDRICSNYVKYRFNGRTDHAVTQERRQLLTGIKIVRKSDNVILYTNMLDLANAALDGFEREDSKSHAR